MSRSWAELEQHIEGWPSAAEIPPGPKLNLGSGEVVLPESEGWVNLDLARDEGVSVICNLFRFPWPIRDHSVGYVMCCHLAEHIPHEVMESTWQQTPWQKPGSSPHVWHHHWGVSTQEDGWFRFFREVHRVLIPGGQCCVISPYAFTWGAMQDPTHVRYLVPSSFSYLRGPDGGVTSAGYAVGYRFDAHTALVTLGRAHHPEMPETFGVNVRADLVAV